jgi:hypothetical protein
MQTFLQYVAGHILKNHPEDLSAVTVVLPTRRAAFFLVQELANAATQPVMSPTVFAVDDFVENICTLQIEDSVHLLFELYETFKEIDPTIDFDRFMGWASVLLSDLDKIDQYMVNTDYLFDYLSEARAIDRWQQNLPSGRTLHNSNGTGQYFSLFDNIKKIYASFRKRLSDRNKAYRGMAYRHLAEHVETLLVSDTQHQRIYFAGFNAFTEAEKRVVTALVKAEKAETIWDTDRYYMQENTGVEAGKSLREYQKDKRFGTTWNQTTDHLLTSSKNITLYGVPNATLQAKVAGQLYKTMRNNEDPDSPILTAIVLADENLLLPMLYSLDEEVTDLNITMGLSLRSSLLYTLIDSLFEMQQNVVEFKNKSGKLVRMPKFGHKAVAKILNHPFIRHYEYVMLKVQDDGQTIIQRTLRAITRDNIVYLSSDELVALGDGHPLFRILFTRWDKNNPIGILQVFYELINLLREVYKDYKNALETEYLYLFYTLLKQFEQTLQERSELINLRTLRSFMFELIRQTRIPFSGEPISDLQILGMLETRALDFERIIILSVNEGIIPQAKKQNSLIPYDAAQAVGLPTYQHQEAVMSYHFYHLIQRASEIHMLYTSTSDAPGGGEKSRFIRQLEYELSGYNPQIKIENKTVVFESGSYEQPQEVVAKNSDMIYSIRQYLAGKGIYPTHLNEFIRCSMQFYLKHIVGVQEKEEVEEELGMDKIGIWLHSCLEHLDKEYFLKGNDPTEEQIKAILKEEFNRRYAGYVTDMGLNRIYFQIGEQQILTFLKHQMQQKPRKKIRAAEQALRTSINLVLQGEHTLVNMGGKIDRIEQDDAGTLYVMDYKTGSVELSAKTKLADPAQRDEMIRKDGDKKMGYVRQLWLYEYLVYRKMLEEDGLKLQDSVYEFGNHLVKSGFYSFRDPKNTIVNPLELTDALNPGQFIAESERLLTDILNEMLDPDVPFSKTNELNTCVYCDFTGICGR